MSPRELFFYADAVVAVMTALMVILHRNPVVCAVSLVLHLCCVAVFFLLLDATFLFAVQIILYAGAIMVLFLFVIMLLDPVGEGVAGRAGKIQMGSAIALAFILLLAVARLASNVSPAPPRPLPPGFGRIESIGRLLFSDYLLPFEVASVLLLVAMIGALYMGKKELD